MIQAVKLEVFYPYPPERVWQVLTDRHALAVWMMDNDFQPKLGHKFRFHSCPLPGFTTTINCEVVELEAPLHLAFTWKEASTAELSLVIWTLTPVAGGTQLHLQHQEYHYTTAVAALNRSRAVEQTDGNDGLFLSERLPVASGLAAASLSDSLDCRTQSHALSPAIACEFPLPQIFGWDDFLNQKLPDLLAPN